MRLHRAPRHRSALAALVAFAALAPASIVRAQDPAGAGASGTGTAGTGSVTTPPATTSPAPNPSPTPVSASDGSGVVKLSDVREPNYSAACDVVFLADGYPAEEQDRFFTDAKKMAAHVDQDSSAAPLRALKKFNYHYIFVPSVDRGAPFAPGGTAANTPFKTYLTTDIMLRCDTAAADAAAAKYAPDVDVVVIVARFADGAGDGTSSMRANSDIKGQGSRVRIPRDADGALVHEFGHALFALGDEYNGREQAMTQTDKEKLGIFPNLSFDSTGAKWASIVQGAVEGGAEWNHGIWHPTASCRMNQCWDPNQAFCPVCIATMGHLPTAKPSSPSISFSGDQPAENVVATVQPGQGTAPWDYYVSIRKGAFSGDEVMNERVEPEPDGKVSIGQLPAGTYTVWIQAENPAGYASWSTKTFTVTGTLTPPASTATAATPTSPTTTSTTSTSTTSGVTAGSPVELELAVPHQQPLGAGGIPLQPRKGITQVLSGS